MQALINAGSSGGGRLKAQLYLNDTDVNYCSTKAADNSEAFLVKFTSAQLSLGHEEGICEAAYLTMARSAGMDLPEWILLARPIFRDSKMVSC